MKKINGRIISNVKVADRFYRMRIDSGYLARASKPGQFVEIRCSPGTEPFLRRPFSVHRIGRGHIELLYEIVGPATEILSRKPAGSFLDILGPLGNGFDINRRDLAIFIGGGIGVAPLVALAEYSKRAKNKVIIGARTKSCVLCEKEFKALGCSIKVSTEDGSKGCKGLATDLLLEILRTPGSGHRSIYACGPTAMLKAVAHIAADHRIPCQVSLEERMACGVGVCLGCPVKVRPGDEYKMVCKDGPVFNAEEIAW